MVKKRVLTVILALAMIATNTDQVLAASLGENDDPVVTEDLEDASAEDADSEATEEPDAVTEETIPEITGTQGETLGAEDLREFDDLTVTKILPPSPASLTTEYKLALQSLLEEMPATLAVDYGGTVYFRTDENGEIIAEEAVVSRSGELAVETWECLDDYDLYLGSYRFTPVFAEDVEIAEHVKKPVFTVFVEHEEDGSEGGYIPDDLPYDVPVVGDRRNVSLYQIHAFSPNRDGNGQEAAYYNGYDEGRLPAIRDQGSEGACWAFASLGAVEMDLITDGTVDRDEIDLSELQLAYYTSHQYDDPKDLHDDDTVEYISGSGAGINGSIKNYLDNGGNATIAYRAMANRVGPVEEAYAPYSKGASYELPEQYAISSDYVRMSAAYVLSTQDRAGMKQAIREHGGVAVSLYASEGDSLYDSKHDCYFQAHYSATYNSFYGNGSTTNHAVMAVGWDDDFPKENFYTGCQPEGDGAWLIRNSWGLENYGKNGYFWLSYYDAGLLSGIAVAYDADLNVYDNCYSYSRNPYPAGTIGDYQDASATFTQTFPVKGGETVRAVGFETADANLTVEVSVTDGDSTVTGSLQTGFAGFYQVPLEQELTLDADTELTVSVSMNGSENLTLICEQPGHITGVYYGRLIWTNTSTSGGFKVGNSTVTGCDSYIRVYTDDVENSGGEQVIELVNTSIKGHAGKTEQLVLTEDSTVSVTDLTWQSLDENIATVSAGGLITVGHNKGSTPVTGTYTYIEDGVQKQQTVTCRVTVQPYHITYHNLEGAIVYNPMTEIYPGDTDDHHWSLKYQELHKQGYTSGWSDSYCTDEALTKSLSYDFSEMNTLDHDIDLYVKWIPMGLNIYFYQPKEDLSGYYDNWTNGSQLVGYTTLEDMPYIIPITGSYGYKDPAYYAPAGMYFTGYSLDAAGEQPISVITPDIGFNLRAAEPCERNAFMHYEQNMEFYVYPQYGDKKVFAERVRILKETEDFTGKTISLDSGNDANKTVTLTAVAEAASGNIWTTEEISQEVLWKSSAPGVATVEDGVVTAVSNGTATVTATATDGSARSAQVTVRVSTLMKSVTITGLNKVAKGKSITLKAVPDPANTSNPAVTWASEDQMIAKVDQTGRVTGVAAGETTIKVTAKDGSGATAGLNITVTAAAERVRILKGDTDVSGTPLLLDPGDSENKSISLSAVAEALKSDKTTWSASGVEQDFTWKSSNTNIATVIDGVVTAAANGRATITATAADGSNKSATVTILNSTLMQNLAITGPAVVATTKTITLKAEVTPADTSNKTVCWTSDKPAIAKVDTAGRVTGVAAGTAMITATAKDGSGTAATKQITVMTAAEQVTIYRGDPESGNVISGKTMVCDPDAGVADRTFTLHAVAEAKKDGNWSDENVLQEVNWKSANESIATVTVTEAGEATVTVTGAGSTTVTATAADGSAKTAKVTINALRLVRNITIPKAASVGAGKSVTLTAAAGPDSAKNKTLDWMSSDTAVATVTNGKVTAKADAAGKTCTITATAKDGSGTVSNTCEIAVMSPADAIEIRVHNKADKVTGATIGLDQDRNNTIDLDAATVISGIEYAETTLPVTWKSANGNVAAVDENGVVMAVGKGTSVITATATDGSGKSAKVTINVATLVQEIRLSGESLVGVGKSTTLTAGIDPDSASNKNLNWTVDKPALATVANGRVTVKAAAKAGDTILVTATVRDGSVDGSGKPLAATHEITVMPFVDHVVIKEGGTIVTKQLIKRDLKDSDTINLTASCEDSQNAAATVSQSVTWKSSNVRIATVAADQENPANATVTLVAPGMVTITATAADGSNKSALVTIKATQSAITITGPDEVASGRSAKLTAQGPLVNWSIVSTSPAVTNANDVTVSAAGMVAVKNTVAAGTVITVKAANKTDSTKYKTCEVTVKKPAAVVKLRKNTDQADVDRNGQIIGVDRDSRADISLVATVTDAAGNAANISQTVTWKTSNAKVAEVDDNGVVKPLSAGTARITATTADGMNKSANVTINVAALVTDIDVKAAGDATMIAQGKALQFTAAVKPVRAANKNVTWSVEPTYPPAFDENTLPRNPVTISAAGRLTVNGKVPAGTTITVTATAKDGGIDNEGNPISDTYDVTVKAATAYMALFIDSPEISETAENVMNNKKIGIDRDSIINGVGGTKTLKAVCSKTLNSLTNEDRAAVSGEVIWSTTNARVATVDQNGVVTSHAAGTAQIKATAADGSNKFATVTINVASLVTSLEISGPDTVTIGTRASVTARYAVARVLPARAADKRVTWTIDEIMQPAGREVVLLATDVRMANGTLTVSKKVPLGTQIRIIATAADGSRVSAEKIVTVE